MGSADQLVAVFDHWVAEGIHEVPAHSNRTPIGVEFGWNGVSWCCESCSVAARRTNTPCFWTAAVAQAIADAKAGRYRLTWVPRDGVIRKGDFATFDWGGHGNSSDFHISCVRDSGTQTKFQTDGGNETDAVRQQWRDRTYVQGFIRPAYENASGSAPTPSGRALQEDWPMIERIDPGECAGIPVPPPHGGAAGGGYGRVFVSLSQDNYPHAATTTPARGVGIRFDGSIYPLWGKDGDVAVPTSRTSAAILEDNTASVSITHLDEKFPRRIRALIEVESK